LLEHAKSAPTPAARGGVAVTGDTAKPDRHARVLLLYYSYTGQARKVLEAAGEVFRERGCEVHSAPIEFTDPRYARRFARFPMDHMWRDFLSVLPAQTRKATGEIRTPDEVRGTEYDLICIGSPTWWRDVSMPLRSFLKSGEARPLLQDKPFAVFVVCRRYWRENLNAVRTLAEKAGGRYEGAVHFQYPGDQLRSMLSLTSYLGSGEYRERYLGVSIPPTNINEDQLAEARGFAAGLADRVLAEHFHGKG
jgi:menaquinone-dependent protoporphyrinogen IX oxidase